MQAVDQTDELHHVRRDVLRWYAREHRDFPWRGVSDPYAVLVSEVMLQQTQASRVAERFPRFMARFPTARALAEAPASAVLAEWSGLGYNRRALALQRTAADVSEHGWSADVAELERLPGIGPYTARALASLAFGRAVGVVDTNVRRWLLRRFSVADHPAVLQQLADELATPGSEPSEVAAWTHATMELGARICSSRSPDCEACPISRGCPSRGRAAAVNVPRQPAFRGSLRAHRGALLRALANAPGHAIANATAHDLVRPHDFERVVEALEREGLVHRSGSQVVLGGPQVDASATATIGA
jgi:A/G-specific adenine glycosylase